MIPPDPSPLNRYRFQSASLKEDRLRDWLSKKNSAELQMIDSGDKEDLQSTSNVSGDYILGNIELFQAAEADCQKEIRNAVRYEVLGNQKKSNEHFRNAYAMKDLFEALGYNTSFFPKRGFEDFSLFYRKFAREIFDYRRRAPQAEKESFDVLYQNVLKRWKEEGICDDSNPVNLQTRGELSDRLMACFINRYSWSEREKDYYTALFLMSAVGFYRGVPNLILQKTSEDAAIFSLLLGRDYLSAKIDLAQTASKDYYFPIFRVLAAFHYYKEGSEYFKKRRLPEAEADFRTFTELAPKNSEGFSILAVLQLEQKKPLQGAKSYLEKARRLDPENPSVLINFAKLSVLEGNQEDASNLFLMAHRSDPRSKALDYFYNWGAKNYEEGHKEEAERIFRKILKANSNHYLSLMALAFVRLDKNDLKEAESLFHWASVVAGDKTDALFQLGKIQRERSREFSEKLGEAEKNLMEAYDAKPAKVLKREILHQLGLVHFSQGNLELAERNYREAISIRSDPELSFQLATICLRLNKEIEAEQLLTPLIRQNPPREEAYYLLGEIYERRHETAQAKALYQRLLQLKPQAKRARGKLMSLGN